MHWLSRVVVVPGMCRVHLIPKVASAGIYKAFHTEKRAHLETPEESGDEFRLVVVRHPLDRLVSNWTYFCQGSPTELNGQPQIRKLGYTDDMAFNDFLEVVFVQHEQNVHTRMQVEFLGPNKASRIIPIDRLDDEWFKLRRRCPEMKVMREIPRTHTTTHRPWGDYYDAGSRVRAEEVFAPDVALFNESNR